MQFNLGQFAAVQPDVPRDQVKVKAAFLEKGPELMTGILKGEDTKKYEGGYFVPTVDDKDYDIVRTMYATIGVPKFSNFLGE